MSENKYPERKTLRLPNYDYSQNGCYFITFCVKDGKPLLGTINTVAIHRVGTGLCARPQELISLNKTGKCIEDSILFINKKYNGAVTVDAYCILPNHVHILLTINNNRATDGRRDPSLREIVGSLKSYTTYAYRKESGNRILWQERYYEHVVRNDEDYAEKYEYIINNPLKWIEKHKELLK